MLYTANVDFKRFLVVFLDFWSQYWRETESKDIAWMLSTSAFERDLWNWFVMSSSPLAPPFTLQMLILGGFLEVFFEFWSQ